MHPLFWKKTLIFNVLTVVKEIIFIFYTLAFFKIFIAWSGCPSLGAKRADIFLKNVVNCITVGKFYLDHILFNVVACHTRIFSYSSDKLSIQRLQN